MDCLTRRAEQYEAADAIFSEVNAVRDLGFDIDGGLERGGCAGGFEESWDGYEDACWW